MKSLVITLRVLLVTAGVFWAVQQPARAQPGSGGPGPGTPTTSPTDVPIDGGASLLLVAGVGFGLKKLRQRRSGRSERENKFVS